MIRFAKIEVLFTAISKWVDLADYTYPRISKNFFPLYKISLIPEKKIIFNNLIN